MLAPDKGGMIWFRQHNELGPSINSCEQAIILQRDIKHYSAVSYNILVTSFYDRTISFYVWKLLCKVLELCAVVAVTGKSTWEGQGVRIKFIAHVHTRNLS